MTKTYRSPGERGEYLLDDDLCDVIEDGAESEIPVFAVYFHFDSVDELEFQKSFKTREEAENWISGEIAKYPAA